MAPSVADVSVQEFADLIGLSSQRIYQRIQEGMPHRKRGKGARAHTRIVPREALRWLREREREEVKAEATPDKAAEEARKLRAEANIKELQEQQMRGRLAPIEEHAARAEALVAGFAAVAGRLQRFERDIVRATTPAAARRLTEQMRAALMEGARDYADTLDAEAAALETTDEDRAA